ncbi:MAG: ATP-binding protein [Desulforhopalus sp.]
MENFDEQEERLSRLYDELRLAEANLKEEKKLNDALGEIISLIHSSLDIDEIIDRVIAQGTEAIEAESAMVFFQSDSDIWEISHIYHMPAELVGRKYESEMIKHSVIAVEKNLPVAIDDVKKDDRVNLQFVEPLGIKSLLDFPLITKKKFLGDVVFHYHTKPTSFSDAHIDFAGKLASSLASALENAFLFKELKSSEEALRKSENQLKLTVKEIERSNKELQKFADVVAHDLHEPLRTVSSFIDLLASRYKGNLDEKADRYIAFALEGVDRMSKMISGLAAYARIGTHNREFTPVNLEVILKQVKDGLNKSIEESNTVITHDPLPQIDGDEYQLAQLFQNLIGNAIKFRKKDIPPRIHISSERKENEWLFGVQDNGFGISPEFHDRIFVIFQRLHTRDEFAGTGLGLSVCRKIVVRHGGRIWVESQPEKGSTFYFTLSESK